MLKSSVSPQSILKATEVCRKYPRLSTIYKVEEPFIRVKITTTNSHTNSLEQNNSWKAIPTVRLSENVSMPFRSEDSSLYEEEYPTQYSRSKEEVYDVPLWLVNSYGCDYQKRHFHTSCRNRNVIDTAKKVGKGGLWVASKSGKALTYASSVYTIYKTLTKTKSTMYRWALRAVFSILSYFFYAFYAKIWPFAKKKLEQVEQKIENESNISSAAQQKAM